MCVIEWNAEQLHSYNWVISIATKQVFVFLQTNIGIQLGSI